MEINNVIEWLALGIDMIGALIMVYGFGKCIFAYLSLEIESFQKGGFVAKSRSLRRKLGIYLMLGLEFMVASDILRTLLDPEMDQLIQLGVVVGIRTLIGYFLGQELKEIE